MQFGSPLGGGGARPRCWELPSLLASPYKTHVDLGMLPSIARRCLWPHRPSAHESVPALA